MTFKNKFILVFFLLIIILLNDFILPNNEILPKLSILFESFKSLIGEYNFFYHFSITMLYVYLMILLVTILTSFMFAYFIPHTKRNRVFVNDANIFFSFLVLLFLLSASEFHYPLIGIIFIFILFIALSVINTLNSLSTESFKNSLLAVNLKLSNKDFRKKLLFRYLFKSKLEFIAKYHSFFWLVILLNEFLFDEEGLGYLFHKMVEYRDYAGTLCLSFITLLISSTGYALFRNIKRKLNNE